MEIEKKFLLKEMPAEREFLDCSELVQVYISTDPVIRIRKKNDSHVLTVKGEGLMAREEFELPLSSIQYEKLLEKASFHPIRKVRCRIPLDGELIAELDLFKDRLEGLAMVEVEFPTLEAAAAFSPPSWFGREVTEDPRYHNSRLCRLDSREGLID